MALTWLRRHAISVVTAAFVIVTFYIYAGQSDLKLHPISSPSHRRLGLDDTSSNLSDRRPVMYTFFEQRQNENGKLVKQEANDSRELLAVWTKLWNKAGFETRILTLKDAMKHPDYERYSQEIVMKSPRMFYGALYKYSYNYMCFMRWLAMAAHGQGGWMSDYDTIPLGITVTTGNFFPNFGVFTSYDGHVPCLLSGTADEWNRMSKIVLEKGVARVKEGVIDLYSDMFALKDIHDESPYEYIQEFKLHFGYPYIERDVVDCDGLKNKYVAHLSHSDTKEAIKKGLIKAPRGKFKSSLRPGWAKDLYEKWEKQCIAL